MTTRLMFLSVVFCLGASPALAQSQAEPEYLSAAQLRAAITAPSGQPQPGLLFKRMGERGNYNYWIVRRDSTGQVERHADWTDVFVVQAGKGSLLYGGQLKGGRENNPGETLGGEIIGGTRQSLATNDMMIIPAGMPHQVWVEPGQSIIYVIIKVKRQPATEMK